MHQEGTALVAAAMVATAAAAAIGGVTTAVVAAGTGTMAAAAAVSMAAVAAAAGDDTTAKSSVATVTVMAAAAAAVLMVAGTGTVTIIAATATTATTAETAAAVAICIQQQGHGMTVITACLQAVNPMLTADSSLAEVAAASRLADTRAIQVAMVAAAAVAFGTVQSAHTMTAVAIAAPVCTSRVACTVRGRRATCSTYRHVCLLHHSSIMQCARQRTRSRKAKSLQRR